ncbi:MAG: hypothetical protein ACI4TX_02955 [Christensenellales bacterium]
MKEIITLYSLNPEQYEDTLWDFEIIENTREELDKIADSKVIYAKKTAIVQARKAKVGEVVDTRPRVNVNGKLYTFSETKQVVTEDKVKDGAIIVKNPDGEEYLIASLEKFEKRYKACEGGFQAIGEAMPFRIAKEDCAIQTSWGEIQYVLKGSALNVANMDDIYSVTNVAFESTYQRVKSNELEK